MRPITSQRDQHPNNPGTLSALPGRRTATLTYDSFQESEIGPIYTATGDNGVTYTINYFDAEYVKVTTSDGQDLGAFYNTDEAMKAVINHEQTGTTGDARKRQ